jgi:hypothetical protein
MYFLQLKLSNLALKLLLDLIQYFITARRFLSFYLYFTISTIYVLIATIAVVLIIT